MRAPTSIESLPVVEPIAVQEIFVTGFLAIEEVHPGIQRLTFVVRQKNTHDQSLELCVNARIVMPESVLEALSEAEWTTEGRTALSCFRPSETRN